MSFPDSSRPRHTPNGIGHACNTSREWEIRTQGLVFAAPGALAYCATHDGAPKILKLFQKDYFAQIFVIKILKKYYKTTEKSVKPNTWYFCSLNCYSWWHVWHLAIKYFILSSTWQNILNKIQVLFIKKVVGYNKIISCNFELTHWCLCSHILKDIRGTTLIKSHKKFHEISRQLSLIFLIKALADFFLS